MIETDDGYKFESTGRTFDANRSIIGINPLLEISEGYDGHIVFEDEDYNELELTKEERTELADYMIKLWQEFKNG